MESGLRRAGGELWGRWCSVVVAIWRQAWRRSVGRLVAGRRVERSLAEAACVVGEGQAGK